MLRLRRIRETILNPIPTNEMKKTDDNNNKKKIHTKIDRNDEN